MQQLEINVQNLVLNKLWNNLKEHQFLYFINNKNVEQWNFSPDNVENKKRIFYVIKGLLKFTRFSENFVL